MGGLGALGVYGFTGELRGFRVMMWRLRAVRLAMSGCLVVAEGLSFSSWRDLELLGPVELP